MRVEVWWDQMCTAVCQHVWGPWVLIAAGVAPECFGILEGKTLEEQLMFYTSPRIMEIWRCLKE